MHVLPVSAGFGAPPASSTKVLKALGVALDASIPKKVTGKNLLIGTWNLRHFGRITKRWTPSASDNPKRNLQDLCCIAEIVSRFDVVALVEIKSNLEALRLLRQALGRGWAFIVSDTVEGDPGNEERLGYVFNLKRVQPSGLVGEVVIPDDELKAANAIMKRQFARTPYCVSFKCGKDRFTLVSLHILWGKAAADRTPEIRRIAKWFSEHAERP